MLVPSMSSSMELQPHLAQLRRKAMGAEGKDKVLPVSWEVERPDDSISLFHDQKEILS